MDKTITKWKQIPVDKTTDVVLTTYAEHPNYISMTPWFEGHGHGITTMDKDVAIKLANALLDFAGGGNKASETTDCTDPECQVCEI
jgi:hypothetical protein